MYSGVDLIYYPLGKQIYYGGEVGFYHVWMDDEHLPITDIEKSNGDALVISPLIGIESISGNFSGAIEIKVNYWPFPLRGDEIFEHLLLMYSMKINIAYSIR